MSQANTAEDAVQDDIVTFLKKNFPQIEIHGGNAVVGEIDLDENTASIQLEGACSGCGVSPMTVQAIKKRLPREIDEITTVSVDADGKGEDDEDVLDGPF